MSGDLKLYMDMEQKTSRGVAILIPKSFEESSPNGRIAWISLDMNKEMFLLINIYAPTQEKAKDQIECWN